MNWMPQAIRDGVIVVLVISGPLVLAAAFIGLAIGILQAATQVQEQTIGSALKIIGVFALIIILGLWMFQYLTQYTDKTLTTAFTVIPNQTQKVVPKNAPDKSIFQEEQSTASSPQIPQLLQPEKLESDFGANTPPPGVPVLGRPEPPHSPPAYEASIPEPPETPQPSLPPVARPKIPLSDFQEPMSIPEPPIKKLEDEGLINYVPGEPVILNEDPEIMLWQRTKVISGIKSDNKKSSKNNFSWLN